MLFLRSQVGKTDIDALSGTSRPRHFAVNCRDKRSKGVELICAKCLGTSGFMAPTLVHTVSSLAVKVMGRLGGKR